MNAHPVAAVPAAAAALRRPAGGRPCFESRALNGVVKLTFPVKVTDRASARESSFLRGVRRRNQAEQGREGSDIQIGSADYD